MRCFGFLIASMFALTATLAPGSASGQGCDLGTNGSFRFLNDAFPEGSQNAEYVARLVVVNADGPVAFSVAGSGDPLPNGLTLDPSSGLITGLPANNANVNQTFQTVKQQLPTLPTLEGFLPSHQVGVAQLAIQYCNELVNDPTKRGAFFGSVNFSAGSKFSTPTGRNTVITPLANASLGTGLNSQDLPGLGAELNALMGKLGCGDGSTCTAAREQVVTKAVCAAAVGNAGVLVN